MTLYKIEEIASNEQWKKFVDKLDENTFLHSIGYEKLLQKLGHKTWKLGLFEDEKLASIALIQKTEAKRGRFLICSHGPQMDILNIEKMDKWTKYLKNLAIKENCAFVRSAPIYSKKPENLEVYKKNKWIKSPIHAHAEQTVVIDLTNAEKAILSQMRKTTRQMCKKGDKLIKSGEVEIEWVKTFSKEMLEVYKQTAKRGGFVQFSQEYLEKEFNAFSEQNNAKMIVVKHKKKVLSWGMFIYTNNRAFYHQGANILDRKIPAAYITHWEGIKTAKEMGKKTYDFWGVSPKTAKKHPWKSISLFKRGFGGEYKEILPAQDYVVSFRYIGTWIIETVRRVIRGF